MHDPDLYTFVDPQETGLSQNLYRMVHALRREALTPVLAADGAEEGTAIGYASAVRDPDGRYLMYYMCHQDGVLRLAVSADARSWQRCGPALAGDQRRAVDNVGIVPVGGAVDAWFAGARWAGYVYGGGLFLLRSTDGRQLELRTPGILPGVGDRSSLFYDELEDQYSLISRPSGRLPGFRPGELQRVRVANLWRSRDLVDWRNLGIVHAYDDRDRPDVEIYGMQPFRHGRGLLAWVEVYYRGCERLETQLAHSPDGVRWTRVEPRQAVLPMGAEGAWDSHWAVPTNNPPFLVGDRMLVPYTGAGTKHGSKTRHRRGIGLASLRRDGWVSLEAGRTEGVLVTRPLPLERPMRLELNVNCFSGYIDVEVLSATAGREQEALPGFAGAASRVERVDAVRVPVRWGERAVVEPQLDGRCHLRFGLQQASLFAFRWTPADGSALRGQVSQ